MPPVIAPARTRLGARPPARTALLWLSLVLNAFLVALLGAHLLRAPAPHPHHGPEAVIARMAAVLPPADAARFQADMARGRDAYRSARARLEQAHAAFVATIAHQPYDAAASRAALATWRADLQEFTARFGDSLVTALADVSPAGREKLAALEQARLEHDRR